MADDTNAIAASAEVERYLAQLPPAQGGPLGRLCEGIRSVAPAETIENIKWNGPNYALDDTDRVTLGIDPRGKVRVVMHRGAKVIADDAFSFDDDTGLVRWAAADRGVITLDPNELDERIDAIVGLIERWLRL